MVTENSAPVLGVLGGMGPGASADFLARLARLTPAGRDQDHVPTLLYADPSTPDRSDSILGTGPSPLPAMLRGIEFLNAASCAMIAMPCNSAHYWYESLASASQAPILHIADATASGLQQLDVPVRRVGVMSTDGTAKAGIYHSRLSQVGMQPIDLTDLGAENPVMRGIRAFKAGDHASARKLLLRGGSLLIERGADALVFGCTDVSAALAEVEAVDGAPVVDASDCLARTSLVELARGATIAAS